MTPFQRAWKAMDDNGNVTDLAIDALMPQTSELTEHEHLVLDRRGWGDYVQDVLRRVKLRRKAGDDLKQMRLVWQVTRDGRRVQASYPSLTRAEHPGWLATRRKARAELDVTLAIGDADAELFVRFPTAETVQEAWKMAGVQFEIVLPDDEATGTEG